MGMFDSKSYKLLKKGEAHLEKKEYAKAEKYLLSAAKEGNIHSNYLLGLHYYEGDVFAKDEEKGLLHMKDAAAWDDGSAMEWLKKNGKLTSAIAPRYYKALEEMDGDDLYAKQYEHFTAGRWFEAAACDLCLNKKGVFAETPALKSTIIRNWLQRGLDAAEESKEHLICCFCAAILGSEAAMYILFVYYWNKNRFLLAATWLRISAEAGFNMASERIQKFRKLNLTLQSPEKRNRLLGVVLNAEKGDDFDGHISNAYSMAYCDAAALFNDERWLQLGSEIGYYIATLAHTCLVLRGLYSGTAPQKANPSFTDRFESAKERLTALNTALYFAELVRDVKTIEQLRKVELFTDIGNAAKAEKAWDKIESVLAKFFDTYR